MKRFKYWLVYYVVIITKELLTNIITSQKEDAADKGTGLKREKLAQINMNTSHAIIISGIRRCGKSMLMKQVINKTKIFVVQLSSQNYIRFR
jgi:predicted AAA+ superfamily ATPase